MSDCCASAKVSVTHPNKLPCPVCGNQSAEVLASTMAYHLKQPWARRDTICRYFFCDSPACTVVYFGEDGSIVPESAVRTAVGVKDASDTALLCYCFGITRAAARQDKQARAFVLAQTEQGKCVCQTANPSGRCCLKDFPRE